MEIESFRNNLFFFQAEDCIRDGTVTGVQTCALPISARGADRERHLFGTRATALAADDHDVDGPDLPLYDGDQFEREERAALRRVQGLSTELEDITEVEYRQLRLERVVLAGVWTEGSAEDAENSIRELAALAETAGSTVLEGVIQ